MRSQAVRQVYFSVSFQIFKLYYLFEKSLKFKKKNFKYIIS